MPCPKDSDLSVGELRRRLAGFPADAVVSFGGTIHGQALCFDDVDDVGEDDAGRRICLFKLIETPLPGP